MYTHILTLLLHNITNVNQTKVETEYERNVGKYKILSKECKVACCLIVYKEKKTKLKNKLITTIGNETPKRRIGMVRQFKNYLRKS